ncbi:MAG: hypothetical protein NC433_06565 [Clostridiales bacterium]|nr:hypothetical protein [Clostridiales bacterium]
MADMLNSVVDTDAEKKRLKEERNKLKNEKKAQKKEAKQRAKEIAAQEAELDEDAGGLPVFFVTLIIVVIWIAILCVLIKLDVGGFGSNILAPVIKDVPVINKLLPEENVVTTNDEESYGGYTSLRDAVDYITELELELERAQSLSGVDAQTIEEQRAEIERLRTFEDAQVDFDRIRTEFYQEVIYAENGPGAEEYRKYYEEIDPTYAEYLYKQVVEQAQVSTELQNYAQPFADMEPAAAAGILENMTGDPELAAKILMQLSTSARGNILAAMDPEFAARLTRIMDPE